MAQERSCICLLEHQLLQHAASHFTTYFFYTAARSKPFHHFFFKTAARSKPFHLLCIIMRLTTASLTSICIIRRLTTANLDSICAAITLRIPSSSPFGLLADKISTQENLHGEAMTIKQVRLVCYLQKLQHAQRMHQQGQYYTSSEIAA